MARCSTTSIGPTARRPPASSTPTSTATTRSSWPCSGICSDLAMSRLADYSHSPRVRRLLRSLVPIVCPPEVERLGVVDAVVDHVALSMRAFPAPLRRALILGLTTYDLAAAAWPPARGRTAGRLPRHEAGAWYAFWWKSPLLPQRELAKAVKALMAIAYYEQPAV